MITRLIHNIGKPINANYTPAESIARCEDRLTFDGIYLNVWENRAVLKKTGAPHLLFVMGNYVGKDNAFDKPMPLEKYCDWRQLLDLVDHHNCELAWHTWSHKYLTQLSDEELLHEITPPSWLRCKHIAYPYGCFDSRVERAVREAGYENGWSVNAGDDSQFQKLRKYL